MSTADWGDIIERAEAERFVGREQELDLFHRHIALNPPRTLIFFITGQGGVGKTALLNQYREIARNAGFLLTDCSEQQRDVPAVLGRFAHQLAEQRAPLKRFDERYKVYKQRRQEIENDPEAPQGLAALIGRAAVRVTYLLGDALPGVRKGLEYLPQEALETQASEWATYLAKKIANKDEIALVREPEPILTSLFFEDLNRVAQKQRVLLCFDNFEVTRPELQDWLLRLPEYKPSQNIRIAIAGREPLAAQWDPLRAVTRVIGLDVFTEREAEIFLDTYSIGDATRRREILEWSGRLPVLMSWLAAPQGSDPDPSTPTHDIVERFLRWVTEPTWRSVALVAAIPRTFNLDILQPLLHQEQQPVDEQSSFAWLQTMPFVQARLDGWHYHSVVRRMMLRYQRQRSPRMYRQRHTTLADWYKSSRDELRLADGEEWANEQWRRETLAYSYHFLAADPAKHWEDMVSLFVLAVRWHQDFATAMLELLLTEDVRDELHQEQNALVDLLRKQLQAVKAGSLRDGFEMFDRLCAMGNLSPQATCYAFAYRGECYRTDGKWEKALLDFERALRSIPDDVWALAGRALTYQSMERYEEALADFDRAIALDEKSPWIIASRGETYRWMGRYEEALADFDRAIALDGKNALAIASRGETYLSTGRYQEALADFNRAIAFDERNAWTSANRGETSQPMGHYEEALADFNRVITLNERSAWAIASRGLTYRWMGRYEEALADFNQAISLDVKSAWAMASRALTYRLMERYQEALADFNRAIALDERSAWIIASRGETYRWMGRYEEALADFNRAIALDETSDWYRYCRAQIGFLAHQTDAFESDLNTALELAQSAYERSPDLGDRWRLAFNRALYALFGMKQEEAQERYGQLIATCPLLPRLQVAAMDLRELRGIQPQNEQALHIYTQLQNRIAEVKQTL
jgi:tetratricopeptide (TPR) repeat protein